MYLIVNFTISSYRPRLIKVLRILGSYMNLKHYDGYQYLAQ